MSNALTYTASTLSFTAATKTIADSASGLGNFIVGSQIIVTGSASNNSTFTIATVSAAALTVVETVVNEAAGSSVTLTVHTPLPYALREIATVIDGIVAIRQVSQPPNETQNVDPYVVVYLQGGILGAGPVGTKKDLYNIAVDLLIPKIDLARDLATLNVLIDPIQLALIGQVSGNGQRFNQTISTFKDIRITYLGTIDYAGVPSRGYSFLMQDVKILVNL